MRFDVDYFIEKFESIGEELWAIGSYDDGEGRHCAVGHCERGSGPGSERHCFYVLFGQGVDCGCIPNSSIVSCSDGKSSHWTGYDTTPKRRILKALRAIKETQEEA